ncbi:unnamed protein product [Adineta steineri]|uniref:G-protein coupled receptors family 1 profile domain-containing protein n=1 Tax=Adineta steineri TaxID=433720 RepID=A0A819AVW6_9BILA|nr:unnamed protein product [Adineta steineri]CAF3791228.1 unnamed protein product [Adineta steineri]
MYDTIQSKIESIIHTHINDTNMNDHAHVFDNVSNSSWYEEDDGPSLPTRLVFACAWIFIAVAGILGNSLVIFVAIRFEKLSNVTNCFIVNLAVTDIVFLAFCMPLLVVQYTLEHWYFNQTFCKLLNFISFVSVLVTVLTLVVMTIDRYIYVVNPFENITWRKPRTVFFLSLIIWLLSCALASPFYYHYGVDEYQGCALLTDENLQKHFRIYTVTLYYFIPLTIILICYTRLLYYVYSKEKNVKPKSKSHVVKWSKKRRAVTKMVAIVTLVFSICWLPITLFIVSSYVFERKTALLYYFKVIGNSFAYLNSAVNPIIYAFLNRSFRNNCGSILTKPTCSLFCRKNYQKQEQNNNHQLTNFFSTDRKDVIIDNNIQLIPHNDSNDDFSDGEYEAVEPDCSARLVVNRQSHLNDFCDQQYGVLLTHGGMNDDRPFVTNL